VAYWNCRGITTTGDACDTLAFRVARLKKDVFVVADTHVTAVEKPYVLAHLRKALRGEYYVYCQHTHAAGSSSHSAKVGGQLIFVRHQNHSGWSLTRLHPDPTQTGAIVALDLHHNKGHKARVVGIYMPHTSSELVVTPNSDAESDAALLDAQSRASMAAKIMAYLRTRSKETQAAFPTAESWIWGRASLLLAEKDWDLIMLGDFNRPPDQLCGPSAELGLYNALHDELLARHLDTESFFINGLPI
jgi:hypothetical protein